jgi:hypothetical protein
MPCAVRHRVCEAHDGIPAWMAAIPSADGPAARLFFCKHDLAFTPPQKPVYFMVFVPVYGQSTDFIAEKSGTLAHFRKSFLKNIFKLLLMRAFSFEIKFGSGTVDNHVDGLRQAFACRIK